MVNAASQAAGPVAPGELVSIYGILKGDAQVLVNGAPATMVSSAKTQLNVITPLALDISAPRSSTSRVRPCPSRLSTVIRGGFTLDGSGSGAGAILNQDFSVNSAMNPATAGTAVMVYATGLGAIPAIADGAVADTAASTTATITATVGGLPAQVL